jgi:DNA polymerase alpha/epsilon subunit B.
MDRLRKLFSGFSQCPPTAIILMGEFLSVQYGHKHSHVLKEKLGGLGMLIADHTFLSGTHFVLVPAQNDSPHVNILPR